MTKFTQLPGEEGYRVLSEGPSSMSGTQEMPHKYFPLYVCMIKLFISSRPLLSFMIDVNNPYLRPQGVTSFWFAGINKCKSGETRSRNPAPSRVVSGCLPSHPGVLTNRALGQADPSSRAIKVASLGLSFVVGWSLKTHKLWGNTAKMQGEASPGVADVVGGTFAGAAGVSALALVNMGVMGQWGILRQLSFFP